MIIPMLIMSSVLGWWETDDPLLHCGDLAIGGKEIRTAQRSEFPPSQLTIGVLVSANREPGNGIFWAFLLSLFVWALRSSHSGSLNNGKSVAIRRSRDTGYFRSDVCFTIKKGRKRGWLPNQLPNILILKIPHWKASDWILNHSLNGPFWTRYKVLLGVQSVIRSGINHPQGWQWDTLRKWEEIVWQSEQDNHSAGCRGSHFACLWHPQWGKRVAVWESGCSDACGRPRVWYVFDIRRQDSAQRPQSGGGASINGGAAGWTW